MTPSLPQKKGSSTGSPPLSPPAQRLGGYFAVCCIDECDAKLRALEWSLERSQVRFSPRKMKGRWNSPIGKSFEPNLHVNVPDLQCWNIRISMIGDLNFSEKLGSQIGPRCSNTLVAGVIVFSVSCMSRNPVVVVGFRPLQMPSWQHSMCLLPGPYRRSCGRWQNTMVARCIEWNKLTGKKRGAWVCFVWLFVFFW